MKLKVIKKGTHMVALGEMNNDVPNPAEVVAESLSQLEFEVKAVVERGGIPVPANVHQSVDSLNNALKLATDQGWEFTLE